MTKHTPGPWTAEPPKYAEDRCGWKIANGLGVAYGWIATGYAPISPLSEANARLIAAAPELLAAAMRGIQALEANGAPNCEAAKELRTAIAKATGQ